MPGAAVNELGNDESDCDEIVKHLDVPVNFKSRLEAASASELFQLRQP
jgi:hypothetical protein